MKKLFFWATILFLLSMVHFIWKSQQEDDIFERGVVGVCTIKSYEEIPNKSVSYVKVCIVYLGKQYHSVLKRNNGLFFSENDVGKFIEVKFLEEAPNDLVAVKFLNVMPDDYSKYKGLPCSVKINN